MPPGKELSNLRQLLYRLRFRLSDRLLFRP